MKPTFTKKILFACVVLFSYVGISQEFNNFEVRYQNNLRGDLTFIANNIVNRDGGTGSTQPEDPYNSTGNSSTYNDWLNMQYIDVDSDATTFSSSRATFNFPQASCNLIRYAGLYWSATYPSAQAGQVLGTGRQNDFNQVKLMVPGGAYVDVTADEVLFDGFTSGDPSVTQNSPYACYADVTALITPLADPSGDYTIANIRSVVGSLSPGGGAAGGWTLIIVYENPTLTGKLITTFDGFARVRSANPQVDINYSGFNTIPVGPVRANIGAAALEGDNRITGDRMRIRAASNPGFTTISNAVNPANNFFNSNITLNGAITNNRNPNSVNTLGYDTDMFLLNNPANSVIPNAETDATFRFTSNGDQYYPFFNSFNVEIIEPNIVVEKTVEDIAGNDITGLGVNLGQLLDYVLGFQNIGNDDATNYVLRDILPVNVTVVESDLVLPPGVTYVYDPIANEISFSIPDNLIEEGDPLSEIRLRVKVAENCFDFVDACTDLIANQAYSTYEGVINSAQITDDPSVSDFDNCGFVTPGATNFLLDDLDSCDYSRTVQLCGDDLLLDAGDNFDSYVWYKDENLDGLIDPGDTLLNDGDPDGDPSTLLITEVGIYIVDKIVADPCKGFQEIITVELFGATQINPIVTLINDTTNTVEGEVVTCPNDGELLPKIFLCGLNDTELIQINIPDADSIEWEQLDEASCGASVADCANTDSGCSWNNVGTGNNFVASDAGQYRLIINYQNGCFSRFYFNIFKNPLDPQYSVTDLICLSPGNITVTNMPVDYEYQLLDATNGAILVPYSALNGPSFTITSNGAYTVEMRQLGVVDGCIFRLEDIGVLERNFQVNITTKDTDCNGLGEISISALDVEPQYYYEISQGGTTVDTFGPSVDNNYTFLNLNDGVYDVLVTTDDGCSYTEQVTINDVTDLAVNAVTTKPIDCTDGVITVTGSGGFPNPDYLYAIWSFNGVTTYTDITDIPPAEFQVLSDFTFTNGEEGDYVFVVVDANNCSALSNTATITVAPAVVYTTTAVDETCLGGADGSFAVNVTNYNGYSLTYTLTYPDTSTTTNASGSFTGLGQGNYSLTLTQTNGVDTCDFVETFTIGGPVDSVTGTAVLIQDYTCLQNGIIEAQGVSGGNSATYEYSIDGVTFLSGPGAETFSNLTNGTYTITIRDASGCVFVTNPVTIDPLNPPSDLTFVSSAPNCPLQTSDVTVTVVDGNSPFLFEIIAPAAIPATSTSGSSADFDDLDPDTYTFRVTDNKGCTYEESYTITPVTPIGVVGQLISNITCFGDTDGEVLYTVSGFATSYDYTVSGPSAFSGSGETNATIPLNNLPAGTYDITVTDNDTNCDDTASVTVNAPAADLTLSVSETQPTCTDPGSVVLTAADGWGGYSYTLTYPDTFTVVTNATGAFTGLVQLGTYFASVTDANGCVVTTTFDLNAALPPVLAIVPNDVCYDDLTGLTLTANVTSGGDGNFEYRINGGLYDTNNVFAGLGPGTYTIDVIDGNNCTGTDTITINPELTVTASAPNITACGTTTDVTLSAAGGDGSFVFAIVADGVPPIPGDFGVVNPITITGAGDYDVYVRDNNGNVTFCEAMYDITIVQDAPITITPTATPAICFGDSNGTITIVAANGMGPYEYSIDNGATYQVSGNFVNLAAGTYPIRVRDANNCEETASIDVLEPALLVAEAVQTQPYTCLQLGEITVGSITPTTGGSGDYQYSLNGGTWTASTPGGTTFTGLIDGTYSIRVRDANAVSCSITLPDVIIVPLPVEPVLSTSITYNCDGTGNITVLPNDPSFMYSIDGGALQASNVFNNIAIGSHPITVDYGSGCTVDTSAVIVAGNAFDANITSFTNLSCNGSADGTITFEVENFDLVNGFEYSVNGGAFSAPQTVSPVTVNGLSAGAYTIEVRDFLDNSCTVTLSETLTEPAPLVASASITVEFTCNNTGATITASAIGGTPSYEYQLEDNVGGIITPYQAGVDFVSVPAGDYIIRARDTNNCEDPIDAPITVVAPANPTFTTTPTACYSGANDGTILVDVTSIPGNGGFQFSINSGPWLTPTPSTATSYTFNNLSSGNYTIDVKDAFGCVGVQQNVTINPRLAANAVLTTDLTCLAPASITINASGGSGTYSYEWSNDAGATYFNTNFVGNVFTSNTDGTYIFRVTDTTVPAACIVITNSVIISPADTPVITTVTPTHILCNGDSTGMLDVVIDTSIGSPPYVIEVIETISTTNYTTQTTGLPAGDYEVTITDAKGCVSLPFPVTINEPDAITYDTTLIPITCTGAATVQGSITVENLAGGTAEYTYYLTSNYGYSDSYTTTAGGEDHIFAILEFGIYEVDVVDANGCSVRTIDIIASPPDDLDIDVTTITANCAVGGTAIVTVSSLVGSGDYQFAILDSYTSPYSSSYQGPDVVGGDTSTFTGLVPGVTYTFVVYDNFTTCYYFESALAPIDSPSNMTVSSLVEANVTCTGADDGNVSFTFDNYDIGATQVDYEIFNAQSNVTTTFTGSALVNPPAGPISVSNFATLPPGVYYILLTEVNGTYAGCSISSPDFTIDESSNILAVTAASPINDNCNLNAGVITATPQFGTAPYEFQYLLDTAPAPTAASPGWISSTTANVESGDYIVYVKDAYDCIQLDPITVALDARPEISLSIVDECVAEGLFEVLVTLDVPSVAPYQLSINGGPFQNIVFDGSNQYLVSGLNSGAAQTIAVSDVNGCADTDPFTIIPPLEFTVMQTALLDCEPGMAANAEITIEVTSGSGTYEFEIDGPGAIDQARIALPSNPYVWTGASGAGAYDVQIHDISTTPPNCSKNVIVDVPAAILPIFSEIHTDVTCNGGADGTVTLIEIDNGNNPLTYTLTPMPVGVVLNDKTFENIPAGTYDVRGTGVNDCFTDIFSITITEPAIMNVPAPAIVEFGCTSGNNPENATLTIDDTLITGGSGAYAIYEFINDQGTPAPGDDVVVQTGSNTTYIETNVTGGSYIINVYDSNGCLGSTTAIILPYDELLTATAAITNAISCNPGMDGEITLTVTSTTNNAAKFEYSIDNGATYQPSNVFSGLDFGSYNFLIRHVDTGCILTASETITDPNTFNIVLTKLQDVICFGTETGEVTIELTDATYIGPFDWTIYDTNGTPANTADDVLVKNGTSPTNGPTAVITLFAGDYLVEVIQNNHPNCTNTLLFNIAGPPAAITANTDVTPISCIGNDGIIEIIDVLGGWGGYSYYVGTVSPTGPGDYVAGPRFENLVVGTYEAWVIDSSGCEEMIQNNIVLADPTPITATLQINQENCTNLQGEIEVIGTAGGQGSNYSYQLIKDAAPFGAPQTSTVFSGLGAGSYEVQITDQWSCTTTTGPEVLYEEMSLISTVVKPIDCTVTPDGEITITVTGGSANLNYVVTFPDLITSVINNTGVFTGLDQPGPYLFVVTDLDTSNPVCTKNITQELDAPTPVTFDPHTVVDVSCNGLSDGSITVNLSPAAPGVNDNPIYSYNLYDALSVLITGPQTSPIFDGLPAGSYIVEAISERDCPLTEVVVINEPAILTVAAVATAFNCNPNNTVNTATITATVGVGTGTSPYLYSIDNINFQSSNIFDVVDTGLIQNITVYAQDANGCTATDAVVINPINVFTVAVSQDVAITCAGPEEITISVTDDLNPANTYTYELLPLGNPNGVLTATPSNTTAEFDLSAVGSYTFRVTDTATGCYVDSAPYIIAPYDLINAIATATLPVVCFGDTNGALEVNVTGYAGGTYNYEVFTAAGVSTGITGLGDTAINPLTITGVSGGNYFVRITETAAPLCVEDSNIITIISPDMPLTATVGEVANVTCTNDQGEILVDPEGGYAPYDIVLTNTTTADVYTINDVNSYLFTGLLAGNFTIAITDDGGCVLNDTEILVQPAYITADITASITSLVCYGDTNSTITAINVIGGEGTYQYQLNYYDPTGTVIDFSSGVQSNPVFNNNGAGIYSITVSDAWNCDVETIQVTITEPTDVSGSLIQLVPLTCTNPAEIELTATGGTAPYEYSTDGIAYSPMSGGNTHVFTVPAGIYQYYVRDSFGCEATISNQVSIDPIIPLSIVIDDSAAIINCTGEATATISAQAFGGLGSYTYELFGDAALTNLISGPQTNGTFSMLIAGSYYVRVISMDCVEVSNEIIITEPVPLQIDRQEFTDVTCAGQNDGTITVEVSGGTGVIQYAITPNLNQFDTENTFVDLEPGIYDVIAQDENGCFIPFQFTITEPAPLDVTYTALPEVCLGSEDGSITLSISGGTAPYSTAFNSNNPADYILGQTSFVALAAGTYVIFVRDAQDCETNVIVVIDPGVNLNAIVEPVYECTDILPENYVNITMEDPTVLGSIMYALDSTDPADMQLNPDFRNSSPGSHFIAISHANGCVQTVDFEIEAFEPLTLTLEQNNLNEITAIASGGREDYTFIYDGFDSGTDTTYYIKRTDTYTVTVIDENGCEVSAQIFIEFIDIEIPNFFTPDGDGLNDHWKPINIDQFPEILMIIFDRYGREVYRMGYGDQGWNGIYHNKELPTGDYWYVIKLKADTDDREFVGHFTLYR